MGNHNLIGNEGNDFYMEWNNNDQLTGGSGDDNLYGGNHNDTFLGGIGNDLLNGGNGDDILSGGNHNDTLFGGIGNDQLTGGSGNDVFQIVTGYGSDLITDFASGQDSLKFLEVIIKNDFTFSYLSGHTRIQLEDDLLAIIQNVFLTETELTIIL